MFLLLRLSKNHLVISSLADNCQTGELTTMTLAKNLWQKLDGPLKVGLSCAVLGIVLTIIGIFRDSTTPITVWSIGMGSLISGVVWGLVSWAIAVAAVEVEEDVQRAQAEAEPGQPSAETPHESQ
jgi:hypothetical protein